MPLVCVAIVPGALAQTAQHYEKPPAPIEQLLDAPEMPTVSVSPDRATLLIEQPASFPTIVDVAQPRYRLAGLRFNPVASAPAGSSDSWNIGLKLQALSGGEAKPVAGLPASLKATNALWSPDSKHIAFVQRADGLAPEGAGLQLWTIDVASGQSHRIGRVKLNGILGAPCAWMPDSSALLCRVVPARGPAPKTSDVPAGPNVEENLGKATPAPTYEDMLQTAQDSDLFEYYASSQLALVPLAGPEKLLPIKGLIDTARPSPDGRYALLNLIHRPFSYTVPYERFPSPDRGRVATRREPPRNSSTDRPVMDNLPISRDAVEPGPRDYQWRSDAPATVVWIEAADGGIPKKDSPIADRILALRGTF